MIAFSATSSLSMCFFFEMVSQLRSVRIWNSLSNTAEVSLSHFSKALSKSFTSDLLAPISLYTNGWYDQLGGDGSPLAEAILDRIEHDAYKIDIKPENKVNYKSMREVSGLDPSMCI